MTDPTAIPITVPPLALTLVHDFAQKGLTVLATTAAGYGLIATSQEAEVVSGGVAITLFVKRERVLETGATTATDTDPETRSVGNCFL